jgi:hypothetical protein
MTMMKSVHQSKSNREEDATNFVGSTTAELQQFVDRHGSIDEAARAADVPREQFRQRCRGAGVRAKPRTQEASPRPVADSWDRLVAYLERVEAYEEQMDELFGNTGFSGYPVQGEMLKLGHDLGFDQKTNYQVANRAVELAHAEFRSLLDKFSTLYYEFSYGDSPAGGGAAE